MPERYDNFIGGKWTPPVSGTYVNNLNPADTRDIVGEFPNSTSQDALNALDATRTAAPEWAALAGPDAGRIPAQSGGYSGGAGGRSRRRPDAGRGQVPPRSKRRNPAWRGPAALLCGGNVAARRRSDSIRWRGDVADDEADSARRGFPHYALELSRLRFRYGKQPPRSRSATPS